MIRNIVISAVLALASLNSVKAETPAGVRAILNAYSDVKFVEETGATDGSSLYWRFAIYSQEFDRNIAVTVPSYCDASHFSACITVALDAVRFHVSGLIPQGLRITDNVPVLNTILNGYSGVRFLGVVPNSDHSEARWAFYAPANEGNPEVIINLSPAIRAISQFTNAYWTAVDAVKCYELGRQADQKAAAAVASRKY